MHFLTSTDAETLSKILAFIMQISWEYDILFLHIQILQVPFVAYTIFAS